MCKVFEAAWFELCLISQFATAAQVCANKLPVYAQVVRTGTHGESGQWWTTDHDPNVGWSTGRTEPFQAFPYGGIFCAIPDREGTRWAMTPASVCLRTESAQVDLPYLGSQTMSITLCPTRSSSASRRAYASARSRASVAVSPIRRTVIGGAAVSGLTVMGAGTFAKRDTRPPLSLGRSLLHIYSTFALPTSRREQCRPFASRPKSDVVSATDLPLA